MYLRFCAGGKMQFDEIKDNNSNGNGGKPITIIVNNHPVIFQDHKTNGLEIKRNAMQQGVAIQEDFILFRVKGNGKLVPISDSESVTLKKNDEFRVTAPDDNS